MKLPIVSRILYQAKECPSQYDLLVQLLEQSRNALAEALRIGSLDYSYDHEDYSLLNETERRELVQTLEYMDTVLRRRY